jgi:hypothetical protein
VVAILLIAGDKAAQWNRWYREEIAHGSVKRWRDTDHLPRAWRRLACRRTAFESIRAAPS